MKTYDYSKADIIDALAEVGLSKGDNIFMHSNIGFFGRLEGMNDKEDYYRAFKEAIFEVIGSEGTLVVPVFSYSFCRGEVFEKSKTPSVCGFLSEMVKEDSQSLRSEDANFSISAIGKNASFFTKEAPEHSFGPGTFWAKFLECEGKFCNFNFDAVSTFIHYVEKLLNVPYRYDKKFPGESMINGRLEKRIFYHFVYDLNKPKNAPDFSEFDKKAKELGLAKSRNLGKGQIVLITAKDTLNLISRELKNNPAFLIKGLEVEV